MIASMSRFHKILIIMVVLVATLLASFQTVFAGAAEPVFDSRICGRLGTATNGNTVRWTNIFAIGDPDTDTARAYPPQTNLRLIGRDFWGCWVQVESDLPEGNGWVPIQSLDVRGVLGLPVTFDNSGGCRLEGTQVVDCPGTPGASNAGASNSGASADNGADNGNVARWTNIFSAPDANTDTGMAIPPNGQVNIVSQDGGWVQITSTYGNGWIPANALK